MSLKDVEKRFMTFSDIVKAQFDDGEEFATFAKLMIDTAKNAVSTYSVEEANEVIRQKMFSILGLDESCSRKELRRAIRKNRYEIFDVIEETVENLLVTGWGENPFFNEFVEVKNMADGDTNEFYVEDESILTVGKLAGNHHDMIRQRLGFGETFRVATSWYGVKVYAEYELFMAGRVDWAKFIQKIYEAYDRYVNDMLYGAVMGASAKLPNNSQWVKSLQMQEQNKDTILELIEDVQAATGKEVVVMGTKSALSKLNGLTPVDWISENMKEERHTTGRLGIWEGTRLVEIPQVFAPNDTSKKMVDNKQLLIMPVSENKFVKLYNEGDAQINEVTDGNTNMDKTVEYEFQAKLGIAVVLGLRFGVVKITG